MTHEYPRNLTFNSLGELVISEHHSQFIRAIKKDGSVSTIIRTNRTFFAQSDPSGMAIDRNGNIYTTDYASNEVYMVSSNAQYVLVLPKSSGLLSPAGIAFDANGFMYIADSRNRMIRKVDLAKKSVKTLAGRYMSSGFKDGAAHQAKLNIPESIAFDKHDNLYIIEQGNSAIRKVDSTYRQVSTFFKQGYGRGLVFDPQGRLMVTSNANIAQISSSGKVTSFSGGSGQGIQDGPPKTALFIAPHGITVDANGNFYVSDVYYIRQISPLGVVKTIANGFQVPNYFGSGRGIAVDSKGNVYAADFQSSYIAKVDKTGTLSVFAGKRHGSGYKDGPLLDARFGGPCDVVTDKNDNIYVSDGAGIRKIDKTGTVTTIAGDVNLVPDGFRNGVGANAMFQGPCGMAFDSKGNLYVADRYNHRIRKILLK